MQQTIRLQHISSNPDRKLMIFESRVTGAVYSWNGNEVVTIIGTESRPVGKIMEGIKNEELQAAFEKKNISFTVWGAVYRVWIIIEPTPVIVTTVPED